MPKVKWNKITNDNQIFKTTNSPTKEVQKKRRHDLRERAKQYIKELTFIITKIEKTSPKPENEFAIIFENEKDYFTVLKKLQWAYEHSYKAPIKLAAEEAWKEIKIAAIHSGLKPPKDKDMFDQKFRLNLVKKLRNKELIDGKPYLKNVRQLLLHAKQRNQQIKFRKKRTECPNCGLNQLITPYIICEKCNFQGPVIGNLYEWFSKEEQELLNEAAIQYLEKHPNLKKTISLNEFLQHHMNFEAFYESFLDSNILTSKQK